MRFWLVPLAVAAMLPEAASAQQSIAIASGSGGRASVSVTVPFGQTARLNGLRVRPVAIVEDSRCPTEVRCVWRGRLTIKLALGDRRTILLSDDKPLAVRGGTLSLAGASPTSRRGERIAPAAYRFQLRFER